MNAFSKFFGKSITASIVPITLYSLIYVALRFFKKKFPVYWNSSAWLGILCCSILYPLNQFSLWILFKPMLLLLDRLMKDDPSKNSYLRGNFAPVHHEDSYEMEIIEGKVPKDINGVYLRNGPNPKYLPANGRYHWFDGNAMVHALRIKKEKMFYCNRYIQTPVLLQEIEAGKAIGVRLGELFSFAGLLKSMLVGFQYKINYFREIGSYKNGTANTSFAHHAKKTYAMVESDYPFRIKIDRNEENFDIVSIGHDDFNGQLTHNISAHPKVDRTTGEMLAFGYDFGNPQIHYSVIDKDRKVISNIQIRISSPRMIHDFAVTENYVIFPDLPLEFRPDLVRKGEFFIHFDKTKPAKYGIMKRSCLSPDQISWFELPNHYVFHYINAWEETNDRGDPIIKLFGCASTDVDLTPHIEHPFLASSSNKPKLSKFVFNLRTGKAEWKLLIEDICMEFPIIDQNLIGQKNKYAYIALFGSVLPETTVGQDNVYFDAVIKYDLQSEQILGRINVGETKYTGEIFYHKKDTTDPKLDEDDGYLMCFVHDWTTNKSEFVMWDAKSMDQTPVVRASCKARVPHGFHTYFIQEKDID